MPRSQRKSFERLIHILTYTTNIEFSETFRSFEIKDKAKKFNEINELAKKFVSSETKKPF